MTKLLQTTIDALSVGSLYALIALGYTMVYGTLKFINFAHGTIFTLGAWFSWLIAKHFGWTATGAEIPWWAAAPVLAGTMVICATIGWSTERLAYRPLRSAPRLNVLITAIGVSLLLENVALQKWAFGATPQRMPTLLPDFVLFSVADVAIRTIDMIILLLAFILMGVLEYIVYGTRLGSAMRAISQDTRTASLLGINVDRTIAITFLIGSGLAGAAGFLFATKYPGLNQVSAPVWILLGLKAFVAAVVGGIGNIRGALVGGLLIAFLELFGAAYLSPHLRDLYVFGLLILVLLFKPSGLLGKTHTEKV